MEIEKEVQGPTGESQAVYANANAGRVQYIE